MKETDIRPSELIKGQEKAFQHDIKLLAKHEQEFVDVKCPACGRGTPDYAFVTHGIFCYDSCPYCGTIYINPRPTPQLLEDYYKDSEHYKYWASKIFPQTEQKRREEIFRPRSFQVLRIAEDYEVDGRLLDIGAGFGTFCEEMKERDWFNNIVAVEPTPELAQVCKNKGINTINKPIEQVNLRKNDCITAFELIEHLFSPQDFIKKCYEILTKNGLLILTCPNVQGFDIAVLKEDSDQFNPEHLNYFNPKSLSLLLENNGFEVLEVSTPGKLDVELVKKQASPDDLTPFMWELVNLGDKFQSFLSENCLSSHLWLVARKK